MTWDEFLHAAGGAVKALPFAGLSKDLRRARLFQIDVAGWEREWKQNLAGENPNDPMSPHQIAEAKAWGVGARRVLRLEGQPYPSPPYPG